MSDYPEVDIDSILKPSKVYAVKGPIAFHNRELLQSWGWYWSEIRRSWICEGESDKNGPRITAIEKLEIAIKEIEL